MDNTLRGIVQGIATDVRYWVEGRVKCPVDVVTLSGYCAIASAELFRRLVGEGLKPEIHVWVCPNTNDAHVFVVVEDHVVDVTATQFKDFVGEIVVIMHSKEAERWEHWNSTSSFSSVKALIKDQKKHKWPADQVAYNS